MKRLNLKHSAKICLAIALWKLDFHKNTIFLSSVWTKLRTMSLISKTKPLKSTYKLPSPMILKRFQTMRRRISLTGWKRQRIQPKWLLRATKFTEWIIKQKANSTIRWLKKRKSQWLSWFRIRILLFRTEWYGTAWINLLRWQKQRKSLKNSGELSRLWHSDKKILTYGYKCDILELYVFSFLNMVFCTLIFS